MKDTATSPMASAWSHHAGVCCDDPHAASASSSSPKRGSISGHSTPAIITPTSSVPTVGCEECHSHQPCPEGEFCHKDMHCDSPSCEGAEVECCEDPACDQVVDTCQDCDHPLAKAGESQEEADKALTEWMCSKEGCEAIEQYLKVCTEQNCSLPVVHPEATIVPQLPEPPPPTAHFHITPHTHPHHLHSQMLPPAFSAPIGMHHTPVTSPLVSWPVSNAATPQHLPNQAHLDNTFALPPSGWSDVLQQTHMCHWQNCHLTFASMPDLLAHVATDHLGAPSFSVPLLDTTAQIPMGASQVLSQPMTPTHRPSPSTSSSIDFSSLNFGDFGINQLPGIPMQPSVPASTGMDIDKLFGGSDGLLSCLWDDCFPLPQECSADPNEACPPHPVQTHHQALPQHAVDTAILHNHTHSHTHDHAHHHHNAAGAEPFSPQTMLRHVLEEHLGVPSDILGWNELLAAPLPSSTAANVKKAHHKLHARPKRTIFPTPPSSHSTSSPSPPLSAALVCQWPGCSHTAPFASSAELMDHLSEEHIGKGKDHYVCKWGECQHIDNGEGRSFRSRQKVLRHLQSHTGHKPFICEECGQAFGEAAPLAAHIRRHAQEKPFVCEHPGCGKRFAISSSLTIHMRTHNGEKPFVCPHCGKGFVEASNLTKHIRTHTGERPFACTHPGCGKRFPRPDQLKRHMGVHDKEKDRALKEGTKRRKSSV